MTATGRFVISLGSHDAAEPLSGLLRASLVRIEELADDFRLPAELCEADELIILFTPRLSANTVRFLQGLSSSRSRKLTRCVCVFTALNAHFGDRAAVELEDFVKLQLRAITSNILFLRTGRLIHNDSTHPHPNAEAKRRRGCLTGLFPRRMGRVLVSVTQLSDVILSFLRGHSDRRFDDPLSIAVDQEMTLLGPYQLYATDAAVPGQLNSHDQPNRVGIFLRQLIALIGFLGVRQLFWVVLVVLARLNPSFREFTGQPIQPKSNPELLRLYHPWNRQYLQTVGMNIGVRHFGWTFPHRTLVQTTTLPQCNRWSEGRFKVNAGSPLKHCVEFLRTRNEQLLVVPNFTWVSAGTAFFVPIHGSASSVSTLGQSIESVLLFDGDSRRFVRARRGDGLFESLMYRQERLLVLLRAEFRTESRCTYRKQTETRKTPPAEEIWRLFFQSEFSHMELRKKHSKSTTVDICCFQPASTEDQETIDVPRDQIGQLWDRIEETPVVSWLFHELVKRYAFHVELFLDQAEFEEFWRHHEELPLLKIQLRRVNKDGMRHSPVCNEDRISADLFMKKDDRNVFCSFVDQHIPNVRWNPGKQSL